MDLELHPSNQAAVLDDYHAFHDAEIQSVAVATPPGKGSLLDVVIRLRAKNHKTNTVDIVTLLLKAVSEYRLTYNSAVDYPNVRDDMAVGFHDGHVFIDLGGASELRRAPDEFRSAENYVVCERAFLKTDEVRP